ncbi:LysM peptidoglycan-binding domain-containing protein [Cryptosporangium sp. NPDC048952]|uniref:LysM peptidoglycan-binding domain-containing protein n=1 Tax=Cryptosporangium sp. NPDC048952 TaxID=3363961 RepID=UPI003720C63E
MVTLKLVPTLSDADQLDPFEQAIRAGAGRSAHALAASRAAHPAGKGRARRAATLRAVPPTGAARLPQQRTARPGPARSRVVPAAPPRARVEEERGPLEDTRPRAEEERSGDRRLPRRGPAAGSAAGAVPAGPVGARPAGTGSKPLRLTKRGRALIRSVVLLGFVLATVSLTVATRADDVTPVSSRSMVVTEHDTLWTIAEEVAPDRPRSETMDEIRDLNDMTDATVHVGQRLLVPAPR